jgi:hypothetical protein
MVFDLTKRNDRAGGNGQNADPYTVQPVDRIPIFAFMEDSIDRVFDNIARFSPWHAQSISNFQTDYLQAMRNMMHNSVSAQKQAVTAIAFMQRYYTMQPLPFSKTFQNLAMGQLGRYLEYLMKSIAFGNVVALSTLDAARENIRALERWNSSMTEYNDKLANAWYSFLSY